MLLLGGSSSTWSMRPLMASSSASRPLFVRRLSSPPPLQRLGMCTPQMPERRDLRISSYWYTKLRELTRPAAISLVPSLSTENALCYQNKNQNKGSLVQFADQEKEKRPDHILLIRVGEFYEAFGLDALMLVQYAGLNPMGKRCRAGCPISNLQATLDDLTAAGLTVAVYEEVAPAGTATGAFKNLKQRALAQVCV